MRNNTDARFEDLYRAHAREVHGYCMRRTSSEEAKDATSEVFLVAWRRYGDVPQGDEALPWLYGVARNVLANRARSVRRRDRLAAKAAAHHDQAVPGAEPQIVRNEEHAELLKALSGLPEKDREILRLVEWEGLSREQVAEMFFVSRAAIDKRIARAYRKMARILGVPKPDLVPTPLTIEEGGEV
jgi:RNA polymerase sigma-70 factor (ECF subfamily)